jgi:hypothetical protein
MNRVPLLLQKKYYFVIKFPYSLTGVSLHFPSGFLLSHRSFPLFHSWSFPILSWIPFFHGDPNHVVDYLTSEPCEISSWTNFVGIAAEGCLHQSNKLIAV